MLDIFFWVLLLIWLVSGFATGPRFEGTYYVVGRSLLLFLLFVIVGLKVFGNPLH